ncbi:DUF262 domain-containing protein [Paenibacillus sp. LHD-117]|uniref:DUF262 domain-containing protein n=1 Tax=Paenibacillus sp. LHD-117 TaxID=3071412 RepID=UPI0027DFFF0B|nr:DUF262 domain-containing protein [Paenibacillus sp. LHD-117]MDQ6423550.1 DUF262 domain-containing protein [Paenibacillus sp. LHD-117]
MARIFGTVLSIGDFFKTETAMIKIDLGDEEKKVFTLSERRKYIIPDYQREIRWKKENVIELISDINVGVKFLGNIILNRRTPLEYEVIDGQQRITTLTMVIQYIKSKFHEELDIFQTCELEMANFDKFGILRDNNFNLRDLGEDDNTLIETSDVFNQRDRYIELWNVFDQIHALQTARNCRTILSNIRGSQINLIVNTNDTDNSSSINYFMDVNLKGVKLDTEDIFKGYLFSLDSGKNIRDEWKIFKIGSFKLNKLTDYPTTKLLEHYLYCDLYKNSKYTDIHFKEDFTINEVDFNGEKHYAGEHLIKVIENKNYMLLSLRNINKFIDIILDILKNESPSQDFKNLFKNLEQVEVTIIHNFIKKIMRDKNVVPRILIMKYVIEILFDQTDKSKKDYRKIYGMYLLAVLFTVFEGEKDIKKVLGVVKDRDWYTKAVEHSQSYFSRSKISKSRITAQYKLVSSDDADNHMFRCKSLATIYNFFEIKNNFVKIVNGKTEDLKTYISDSNKFSTEHFIINESGGFTTTGDTTSYKYPSDIKKKYTNSIFNFIFISKELNQSLGNNIMFEKIRLLNQIEAANPGVIECEFSEMIIDKCKKKFTKPFKSKIGAMEALESYYADMFIEEFNSYAQDVIKTIGEKLHGKLNDADESLPDQAV